MYYYHLQLSLYSLTSTNLPPSIFDTQLPLPLAKEDILQLYNTQYRGLNHVGSYRCSTTLNTVDVKNDLDQQLSSPQQQSLNSPPTLTDLQISDNNDNVSMKNSHLSTDTEVTTTTSASTNTHTNNDFRLGPIDVEYIDKSLTLSLSDQRQQVIQQYSLGYGIIHLYRDKQQAPDDLMPDMLAVIPHSEDIGFITCTLAVPSSMTTQNFLTFVKPFDDTVLQYRFIKDVAPNKYMVLMKFQDVQSAYQYHHKFNGRSFHGMEPEICHIVFISSVTWMAHTQQTFPLLKDTLRLEHEQQLPTQLSNTIELPTCPVCLERLDKSVSGLLGITCQHSFDCGCLGKWGDGNCHICRFSEKPVLEGIGRDTVTTIVDKNHSGPRRNQQGWLLSRLANDDRLCCYVCGEMDSLWICMICGHIGCGRYQEAHAYDHYMETRHLFALEIDTQMVWDYEGDGYVHRLIQNTVDGKLVELPGNTSSMVSNPYGDGLQEKNDTPEPSSSSSSSNLGPTQHGNWSGTRLDGWHGYGESSIIKSVSPSIIAAAPSSSSSSSALVVKPTKTTTTTTAAAASSAGSSTIKYKNQGEQSDSHTWMDSTNQQDKLEAMSMEYTALLTSQLESQQIYYEDQLDALTQQLSYLSKQKSDLKIKHQHAAEHHHHLVIQSSSLQHENDTLKRAQVLLQGKNDTWKKQYEVDRKNWEEEKKITTMLSDSNATLKKTLAEKQAMVADLNEELRDLVFFVEARNKIQQQMPDMVGGSVGTAQRTLAKSNQHRRGKKGKK
ncbi:BRCA1-associated protein 2-domain-containing protein [Chlamydoabsidia padenii]|nr:BRCA1-associated protein 2-domain-containing protein [Chlamydoabsidia padenii]